MTGGDDFSPVLTFTFTLLTGKNDLRRIGTGRQPRWTESPSSVCGQKERSASTTEQQRSSFSPQCVKQWQNEYIKKMHGMTVTVM